MQLVDTHTHLYLKEFDEDRHEMLQSALNLGVDRIFLPNIDKSTYQDMMKLVRAHPKTCFPMIGLHPCSVNESYEDELSFIESELAGNENYAAIGETGLDYYWDKTFIEQQKEAFNTQIRWAKRDRMPLVIHTRNSFQDAIQMIENESSDQLSGIFHCFGGSLEDAQRIINVGFYLGIGGVVTFKNSGLDKTMAELELKNVVLETDAPYLAPHPYRGKRNETAYVLNVAEKLAEIYGIPLDEVARQTTDNALKIFKH